MHYASCAVSCVDIVFVQTVRIPVIRWANTMSVALRSTTRSNDNGYMTDSPQNTQTTLSLTLPRADRAAWHHIAMLHGLRPGQLATALLAALAASEAVAQAVAEAAEEVRAR